MTDDTLKLAPRKEAPEPESKSFWKKLRRGLRMTHTEIFERFEETVSGKAHVDEETIEYLEESLIGADLGVETALELLERLRADVRPNEAIDVLKLRERLVDEMAVLLLDAPQPPAKTGAPLVTLLVGVNGTGKTTSAAKLARRSLDSGESVLLAAADTFRAAAIEQLVLWGERLGVDVIRQKAGGDPAAVVFDALQAGRARNVDHLIVDTAGRLHNKDHLMAELSKIKRIVDRDQSEWERRTVLVLDATTGQNAVTQAREFGRAVDVDGVLLAKIDGTAKGGVAVAIARDLRLPILYLGVGETPADLVDFRAREFAQALLGPAG
jgi:fused signal recognition particle receptor